MTPDDFEDVLRQTARARANADALTRETANLAATIADGFRRDFDTTLDMETVGAALVITAASLVPLTTIQHIPPGVLVNMLALAGEDLVRNARARAHEAGEELLADLEDRLKTALADPRARTVTVYEPPKVGEFVLTWHPVDGREPTEIPFDVHVACPEQIGEFRLSTRDVPEPTDATIGGA